MPKVTQAIASTKANTEEATSLRGALSRRTLRPRQERYPWPRSVHHRTR